MGALQRQTSKCQHPHHDGRPIMTRFISVALLATSCLGVVAPAFAQNVCPEGRTAAGQCVKPGLAASQRQAGVIYSQPKLSYTHYPVLPVYDWNYRYPHQLNPDQGRPSQFGIGSGPPIFTDSGP